MKQHVIKIDGGEASAIYSDDLAPVMQELGAVTVTRASHVEPHPTRAGWVADMTPSDGRILGSNGSMLALGDVHINIDVTPQTRHLWDALDPFTTREAALEAERAWLATEKGL